MQSLSSIENTHNICRQWKEQDETIAFVPTMGCLHEGHISLIQHARTLAKHVVVSIFVNPLQFDNSNDLANYPNTLAEDGRTLKKLEVDLLFTPTRETFYSEGENKVETIKLGEITTFLEGAHRPGHFDGVATVVKRLFEIVQPNYSVFGEKDFQQLLLIQQLVKKYALDIEIVSMPTLREASGLAMSSRNTRLSDEQRNTAAALYEELKGIQKLIQNCTSFERDQFEHIEEMAFNQLKSLGFVPEYVAIREDKGLLLPHSLENNVILLAAKLGEIRLIDNLRV
ncbi:MAG: pantoate--beta-alanine ligase [Woeseiaceae bacterium]